jgi:type I restriction enzyme R subunit
VFSKARLINTLGNRAVHSHRAWPQRRAVAVRELFHFGYWLARTYGRAARPAPGLSFDASCACPRPDAHRCAGRPQSSCKSSKPAAARARREARRLAGRQGRARRGAAALRAQVAAAKQANSAQPDTHDYSEAETREATSSTCC